MAYASTPRNEISVEPRYLTDDQLRRAIEAVFFSYQRIFYDPDRILQVYGYGRAHHRALHFICFRTDVTVTGLLDLLGVTRQSLNRVLRELQNDGMLDMRIDTHDRRRRIICLTPRGETLASELFAAQRDRLRKAFRQAGSEAVGGFRAVMEAIAMGEDARISGDLERGS
ncbi:MAG: MarR family transcriptional regulator [Rhodobacteraceae bacterium]|nr:MarR family transcriptional regulator [Paracoccaceae bacterium]